MIGKSRSRLTIEELQIGGYDRVVEFTEPSSRLHAIVAIHDRRMGPALGGVRAMVFSSREEALHEVLGLARGMTYKSAIVHSGFGGGKAVILVDPEHGIDDSTWRAFGDALNYFEGEFITGKDMGTTLENLRIVSTVSPYVAGFNGEGHSGDPCPFTAWGVLRGMEAAAQWLWKSESLEGRRVAVQGLGGVGMRLADALFWKGAQLLVADIDRGRTDHARLAYGAEVLSSDRIAEAECDIYSPCAQPETLNEASIPKLRCQAVVGAANSQLAEDRFGATMRERGILYAPDFVVNSGGLLNVSDELNPTGYSPQRVRRKVEHIYDSLIEIFRLSDEKKLSTEDVAIALAEKKLQASEGQKRSEIRFPCAK